MIVLRTDGPGNWWLTDEGNTYLHLSIRYDLTALKSGTCGEQLAAALDRQGVADRRGSLVLPLEDGAELGRAVCEFAQCLIQIDVLASVHGRDLGIDWVYICQITLLQEYTGKAFPALAPSCLRSRS